VPLDEVPSKVVIGLCEKDLPLARACLETWVHAGNSLDDVIQVSTDGALLPGIEAFLPKGIPQSHPEAPNAIFRYLIEKSCGSFSFLFVEPDCAFHPTRARNLLAKLEGELVQKAPRRGCILATPTHVAGVGWTMNGVSFYPHDIGKYIDLSELPEDEPFDHFLRHQVYPDLLVPTGLIAQCNTGSVTNVESLDIFGPIAALFHGVKDKSLAKLCLTAPKES